MRLCVLLVALVTFSWNSFAQNAEINLYRAGFKTLSLIDSTRIYKPGTPETHSLHYRPVDLDIWYPSSEKTGERLLFGDLFLLFEQRAVNYQDNDDYSGITEELALFWAAELSLGLKSGSQLLNIMTDSYENIRPAEDKFPLIIYMAGFNGMGFENFKILENLAANGYIIVSIWSFGRYPGNMTNEKPDMLAQVYDAEFALKALQQQTDLDIDFENIGVLGCSWGGMGAAVLAGRNPEIKAMVSLDGSETHYYGESEPDDDYLNEIYEADLVNPGETSCPYLYMESGNKLDDFEPDKEYHYFKKTNSPKYYLRFMDGKHEDFLCIPSILKVSDEAVNVHSIISGSSLLFFNEYLKNKAGFATHHGQLSKHNRITTKPFNIHHGTSERLILNGKILDAKTRAPLPYVNIGILNKDKGTVSAYNGTFELELGKNHGSDTIRISAIGYKSRIFPVQDFFDQKDHIQIKLEEEIAELNEIVITAKSFKSKVLGNRTKSKFLSTGFFYDQLGAEMGIRINVRKAPTYVDAFNFHISYNRLSANALFRLNIYNMIRGKPFENILDQNIIIPINAKQTGSISIDLKEYNIVLKDDVIVTLEWVEKEGDLKKGEGIYFSLGLITGGTYLRHSSQGKMKKMRGMGIGFNMNVRY